MLIQVLNGGKSLYHAVDINGLGQATQYTSANGIQTSITYDKGIPARFYTPQIQDLHFVFDQQTANLTSRRDALHNMLEEFTYDNLNRLTGSYVNQVQQFGISYDGSNTTKGNIINKTDVGDYVYQTNRPNAVAYISPLNPALDIANSQLAITHTSFQRPLHIENQGNTLDLAYGIDDERIQTRQVINGQAETRLFLNNYERQHLPDGTVNEIIYVGGGNGLCAMIVNGGVYAVYKDYLGSILTLTDEQGTIIAEQNFDAWGRKRNTANWSYNVQQGPVWLIRGFTGHEDLAAFGLINMNARLYDPLTGRMLSPDNYIPTPYHTQGYNRYSYANNNPLVYTDPDGNIFGIDDLVLGLIGGLINVGTQLISGNVASVWQGFQYFGVGFAAGLVSEYTLGIGSGLIIGAGNAWVAGGTGEQILTSAVIGGISAGVGSSLSGLISPYVSSVTSGLGATASSAATQVVTSTVVGGALGAGIAGISGGDAGAGFRSGLLTGFAGGALNAGIGLGKGYLDGRRQSNNIPGRQLSAADPMKMSLERSEARPDIMLPEWDKVRLNSLKATSGRVPNSDFSKAVTEWNNIRAQYNKQPVNPSPTARGLIDYFNLRMGDGSFFKAEFYNGNNGNTIRTYFLQGKLPTSELKLRFGGK
ncbi:MAG: RHS repeat-associated core domain-containing protein [Chitinophagaceae bacterium]